MKRIKILYGGDREMLQTNIDKWIAQDNPDIISCSISIDASSNRYVAIVYEDNAGLKI
jgi:hypothetical protein